MGRLARARHQARALAESLPMPEGLRFVARRCTSCRAEGISGRYMRSGWKPGDDAIEAASGRICNCRNMVTNAEHVQEMAHVALGAREWRDVHPTYLIHRIEHPTQSAVASMLWMMMIPWEKQTQKLRDLPHDERVAVVTWCRAWLGAHDRLQPDVAEIMSKVIATLSIDATKSPSETTFDPPSEDPVAREMQRTMSEDEPKDGGLFGVGRDLP